MKKKIIFLLIITVVFSSVSCLFTVNAAEQRLSLLATEYDGIYKYEGAFREFVYGGTPTTEPPSNTVPTITPTTPTVLEEYFYKEEYEYADQEANWVLINASAGQYIDEKVYGVFGNRVLISEVKSEPFGLYWGVFNANTYEFVDLVYAWKDEETFPNLHETFEMLKLGIPIGDMDRDKELTVIDATHIQKCMAQLESYPDDDILAPKYRGVNGYLKYISDFDHDNERTIIDATAIQRHLANLK